MRTVLLDGTPPGNDACRQGLDALRRAVSDAGHPLECFSLFELPMAPCRGCFACWTATPGRCPVPDAAEVVARAVINSELTVVFSPLPFGVWNHVVKKALDRMICLVSPHFVAAGLTRHRKRYPVYPAFLGVGWLPGPDPEAQAVFARLVEHNAYNLCVPAWRAVVLTGEKPWAASREVCRAALGALEHPDRAGHATGPAGGIGCARPENPDQSERSRR
jgi:multimeric flavodoxin WrbA